jgi:hypothetical protein
VNNGTTVSNIMAPPSTNDFVITNYDVLADEVSNPINSGEKSFGLSLTAHSYHVGNNRLEVLCNIHNQAYSDHQAKGDESNCAAIIDKIMDIVQNQCVPKGRFLERNNKGEWNEVDAAKARLLVRQTLTKVENHQSSSRAPDVEHHGQDKQQKEESDAEKKRRRRSSLLRRSVSASMLPNLMSARDDLMSHGHGAKPFDDKKKSTRRGISPKASPENSRPGSPVDEKPRPMFGRSQSVDMAQANTARRARRLAFAQKVESSAVLVNETLKMDVLLNTAKTALLPGTDLHGNNRLRVMVQIQTAAYNSATEEEQVTMAKNLINTIENFWEGRILSKVPTMRGKGEDCYVKLENEHAVSAIKNLLSGIALEKEEEITMGDNPDVDVKQGRRASLKAIQSLAASGEANGSASILPSSLPSLPPDMLHMRSAAVKSLQKRKQRQGLNSRIRGLTADKAAVFQDGGSNASVTAASIDHRSTSPTKLVSPVPSLKVISNMPSQVMHNVQPFRQASSGASVASTASQMSTTNSYLQPFRQASSGASVASTASQMSTTNSYTRASPSLIQREVSVGNMSTGSTNTQMTMNTMNAARTIANINLGGRPNRPMQNPGMLQMGATPIMGSDLQLPGNMMPAYNSHVQSAQTMQQYMARFPQRVAHSMPYIPENANDPGFVPRPLTAEQLAQLNQGIPDQYADEGDVGSLYNSTGSEGHPRFSQGEMELLIKGLEMAENQPQQDRN